MNRRIIIGLIVAALGLTTIGTAAMIRREAGGRKMTVQTTCEIEFLSGSTFDHQSGATFVVHGLTFTATEMGYLDGVTPGTAAEGKVVILDDDLNIATLNKLTVDSVIVDTLDVVVFYIGSVRVTATAAELNYLDVTAVGTAEGTKALVTDGDVNIDGINKLSADSAIIGMLEGASDRIELPDTTNLSGAIEIDGTEMTASGTQLNYLSGVTPGTAAGDKAPVLDSDMNIATLNRVDADSAIVALADIVALELGSVLVTATAAEVNYVDVTPGAATAGNAAVLDDDKNIATLNRLDADSLVAGILEGPDDRIELPDTTNLSGTVEVDGTELTATGTQLNYTAVTPGTVTANRALVPDGSKDLSALNKLTLDSIAASANRLVLPDTVDATAGKFTIEDSVDFTGPPLIDGTELTATAAQLNYTVVTPGTAAGDKALVLDGDLNAATVNKLTADSLVVGMVEGPDDNIVVGDTLSITTGVLEVTTVPVFAFAGIDAMGAEHDGLDTLSVAGVVGTDVCVATARDTLSTVRAWCDTDEIYFQFEFWFTSDIQWAVIRPTP